MTIRSDTRVRIKAIILDAMGEVCPATTGLTAADIAMADRKAGGWTDDFMQTDPLRLAELAESNPEGADELAVVRGSLVYELGDILLVQLMDEAVSWSDREHRKVVAQ